MNKILQEDKFEKIISSVPESNKDSFFLSVFNNNQAIMLLVDSENNQKVLDANEAALKFYGYSREQILKLDMGSINTKSLEERKKIMKKAIKLPNSYFQFEHKTSSGEMKNVEINASRIVYNNKKVMFIIVHDITDLKTTESALKESEERFKGLSEATAEAVFLSENGICFDQNIRAEELFGYTHNEAVGVPAVNWIISKDRDLVSENIKSEYSEKYEVTGLRKDGSTFPAEIKGKMLNYKGRKVRVTALRDLTESKKFLAELKKSNEQFELAMAGSNLGLWDWMFQTGDLQINERWAEMLGYSLEEILPVTNEVWRDLCHPDDLSVIDTHFQKYLRKEIDIYRADFRMKHKNGNWIWLQTKGKVFEWTDDGKPLRVAGTHLDISEKKKIELKLALSEERLGLALAGSELGLWDGWVSTGDLHVNERWAEMLGYSLEELFPVSNDTWLNLCHPEDLLVLDTQIQQYLKEKTGNYKADLRMKHKDGSWIWVQTQGKVFEWTEDGTPLRVAGTHLDINEKKNIELKLAESEERLGLSLTGSEIGIWDWHIETGESYYDERWANIFGYTLKELSPVSIKTWIDNVHPEDLEKYNIQIEKCFNKEIETHESEIRMKHKDGSWVWVLSKGKVVEWSNDGKPIRSSGTHLNITERKQAELKLAESEAKFRSFFDNSPSSLWEQDFSNVMSYLNNLPVSGTVELRNYFSKYPEVVKKCVKMVKILDVNSATLELYEAQSKEDLFWNLSNVFTEEAFENFKEELICFYNKNQVFSAETNGKTLKGKIIRSRLDIAMLSDYKVLVTITDITEQKSIEKQLIDSEAKFRSYFESSPLALWEEDYTKLKKYLNKLPISGEDELLNYLNLNPKEISKCLNLVNILNMNQSTLDLYEADSKEIMIENFTNIFTPESLDDFKNELISLYNNDKSFKCIFADRTLKGREIVINFEMTQLSENRYLNTSTDITELKNKEYKLQELLAQTKADSETKEILLREINHRVKNHLSSFIGMLYAEKKQSGTDPDAVQMEHVDNLINRVKGISIAHEMLSRSLWTPISVYKLIEKIIHSLHHLIPKDRIIDVKLKPSNIFLDADQSHSTAILLNELFSNSIEHATRPGEKIVVKIEIKEKKGTIFLLYRDSGPGYPEEILKLEFKNVGMYLIKNIVEQSLRGTFQISNKNGAIIEIEFPGGSKLEEL